MKLDSKNIIIQSNTFYSWKFMWGTLITTNSSVYSPKSENCTWLTVNTKGVKELHMKDINFCISYFLFSSSDSKIYSMPWKQKIFHCLVRWSNYSLINCALSSSSMLTSPLSSLSSRKSSNYNCFILDFLWLFFSSLLLQLFLLLYRIVKDLSFEK